MTPISCRRFFAVALLLTALSAVAADTVLSIDSLNENRILVTGATELPAPNAIYDVYRSVDEDGVYRDLVDSVYFVSGDLESGRLFFNTVWTGGARYIEEDFLLVPTGRTFQVDRTAAESPVGDMFRDSSSEASAAPTVSWGAGTGLGFAVAPASEMPSIGFTGEFFLDVALVPAVPLSVHARGFTSIDSTLSGFDGSLAYMITLPDQPALSASLGMMFGAWTFAVDGGFSSLTDPSIGAGVFGTYVSVRYLPTKERSFGFEAAYRAVWHETTPDLDMGVFTDITVSVAYRVM